MKPNLEKDILESKKILDGDKTNSIPSYSSCYLWTTEHIKTYLEMANPNIGSALTVIGSGDQIFNLTNQGFLSIDAFDINVLTYYLFMFKKAILSQCSYDDWLAFSCRDFYFYDLSSFSSFLLDMKSILPQDIYIYYDTLLQHLLTHYKKADFTNLYPNLVYSYSRRLNFYANRYEDFKRTQENLRKLSVQFLFEDVRTLPSILTKKYDIIILSNILEWFYIKNHELIKFIEKEDVLQFLKNYYPFLKDYGVIVNYIIGSWEYDYSFISQCHKIQGSGDCYYLERKREQS